MTYHYFCMRWSIVRLSCVYRSDCDWAGHGLFNKASGINSHARLMSFKKKLVKSYNYNCLFCNDNNLLKSSYIKSC